MLFAALIAGGVTAYWFGMRAGIWAAGGTLAACVVAVFVPSLATPLYVLLAAGMLGVCLVGPRRQRPPDAVRATRWVRRALGQVIALARGRASDVRKGPDDQRRN